MNGTTIWLSQDIVDLVDDIQEARKDPRRSDTIRYLILRSLAEMSYLTLETKKALGIKIVNERKFSTS